MLITGKLINIIWIVQAYHYGQQSTISRIQHLSGSKDPQWNPKDSQSRERHGHSHESGMDIVTRAAWPQLCMCCAHKERSGSVDRYRHSHTYACVCDTHECNIPIRTYIPMYAHTYIHRYSLRRESSIHRSIDIHILTRMHTWLHIYIHTSIHVHIPTRMHAWTHTYIYIHTHDYAKKYEMFCWKAWCFLQAGHVHVYMHVCMYVSRCMYVRMYVRMYVCTYVCMYICMYVCIHVCMYVCMSTVYAYVCISS